jgi:hypothetical protein
MGGWWERKEIGWGERTVAVHVAESVGELSCVVSVAVEYDVGPVLGRVSVGVVDGERGASAGYLDTGG